MVVQGGQGAVSEGRSHDKMYELMGQVDSGIFTFINTAMTQKCLHVMCGESVKDGEG